jgi:hypothetical protein
MVNETRAQTAPGGGSGIAVRRSRTGLELGVRSLGIAPSLAALAPRNDQCQYWLAMTNAKFGLISSWDEDA